MRDVLINLKVDVYSKSPRKGVPQKCSRTKESEINKINSVNGGVDPHFLHANRWAISVHFILQHLYYGCVLGVCVLNGNSAVVIFSLDGCGW